ncbi:MAG: hypothetical protein RLZ98_1842 [Pseudomonadota bacterium]|jgi:uncharacterized tellurite resistance protein B-like protein
MLKDIRNFISDLIGEAVPAVLDGEEERVACAALLVHAARIDGGLSEAEEAKAREILAGRFGLTSEETDTLISEAAAREAEAVDVHRFTRVLYRHLDREGRKEIVRLLWEITHADGSIDHEERGVVGLVARLLHVEVHDAVALRRSVSRGNAD